MPTARGREIASTGCRHHPDASPKLNGIAKEDVRQQTAKPMQSIPRSGMADLQYASCLDNSNHPEADRALPSIWTLFCCQSAQEIVRYRSSLVWLCTALMASWPCTRTVRGRTRRSANKSRTGAVGRERIANGRGWARTGAAGRKLRFEVHESATFFTAGNLPLLKKRLKPLLGGSFRNT